MDFQRLITITANNIVSKVAIWSKDLNICFFHAMWSLLLLSISSLLKKYLWSLKMKKELITDQTLVHNKAYFWLSIPVCCSPCLDCFCLTPLRLISFSFFTILLKSHFLQESFAHITLFKISTYNLSHCFSFPLFHSTVTYYRMCLIILEGDFIEEKRAGKAETKLKIQELILY